MKYLILLFLLTACTPQTKYEARLCDDIHCISLELFLGLPDCMAYIRGWSELPHKDAIKNMKQNGFLFCKEVK